MDIILRIFNKVAASEGLKIGTLEKSIGASKGVLSRAIKNGTDVQSKWLLALIKKYPNYNYSDMLTGEFSTNSVKTQPNIEDPAAEYAIKDLKMMHSDLKMMRSDLKEDLKSIAEGMIKNFEVISTGIMQGLMDQRKLLDIAEKIDADKIKKTSEDLEEFLKQPK